MRSEPPHRAGLELAMPEVRAFPSIPTKILLLIDFSPSSQAALEMAANSLSMFTPNSFS